MTTLTLPSTTKPFDFNNPQLFANPWPTYAHFRQQQPLVRAKLAMMGEGWLVSRYEDVLTVLKDPRFSNNSQQYNRSTVNAAWLPKFMRTLLHSMLHTDDPHHARLRTLVHLAFTPKRVEALGALIHKITERLLDAAAAKGQADLMADFALPLPLTVISEMMGVAEADRQRFHHWFSEFFAAPARGWLAPFFSLPNAYQMHKFFLRLIHERRTTPQDDLISALVQAEQAGDRLSEDELLAMIFLLLLAGHETTVNLIGNGTLALLQHPAQFQRLRQHPELADSAVEELLRFGSPVEMATPRYARETVIMHGVTLPPGAMMMGLISSANRDETVFENPEQLDLARHPNRHLGFGNGIHYCLGAPLARLEGQIAFKALTQRFPNLRLAVPADQLPWRNNYGLRGLKALPLHFA